MNHQDLHVAADDAVARIHGRLHAQRDVRSSTECNQANCQWLEMAARQVKYEINKLH